MVPDHTGRAGVRADTLLKTTLIDRVRAEYREMPGMKLTARQVGRLCGVGAAACEAVLDSLVREGFLCARIDGTYTLSTDGDRLGHRSERGRGVPAMV
jgi:hypothetical protein